MSLQIAAIADREHCDLSRLRLAVIKTASSRTVIAPPAILPASAGILVCRQLQLVVLQPHHLLLPLPAAGLQPAWPTPPETTRKTAGTDPKLRPFHAEPMQNNPRSGARMPPFGPQLPTIPRQISGFQQSCKPSSPRTRESRDQRTDLPPRNDQKKWAEMTPKRTGFNAEIMQNRPHFGALLPHFGPLFQANPRANFWPQADLSSHSSPRTRDSSPRHGGMMSPRRARRPRRWNLTSVPLS